MRLRDHPFIVLCEAPDTELFIGFYRGGCTIKDWSNTSVCLTQFCSESKSLNTTSIAVCFVSSETTTPDANDS